MVSSARVSKTLSVTGPVSNQEEDLLQQSTKKVKDPDEIVKTDVKSYKESLLKPLEGGEIAGMVNVEVHEEVMVDNMQFSNHEGEFGSHPKGLVIPVSDEELAL